MKINFNSGFKVIVAAINSIAIIGIMGFSTEAQADDDYYPIKSSVNGQCLAVASSGTGNGSNVITWGCMKNNDDQKWRLEGNLFRNKNSNKCLAVSGNATWDGANVNIWGCPDNSHGNGFGWQLEGDSTIVNENSKSCLANDVGAGNVHIYACYENNAYHKWTYFGPIIKSLSYSGRWVSMSSCNGCDSIKFSITEGIEEGKEVGSGSEVGSSLSQMFGVAVEGGAFGVSLSASAEFTNSVSQSQKNSILNSFSKTASTNSDYECNKGALYQWQSTVRQGFQDNTFKSLHAASSVYLCTTPDDKPTGNEMIDIKWSPCTPVEVGTDYLAGKGTASFRSGDSGFVCKSSLTAEQLTQLN